MRQLRIINTTISLALAVLFSDLCQYVFFFPDKKSEVIISLFTLCLCVSLFTKKILKPPKYHWRTTCLFVVTLVFFGAYKKITQSNELYASINSSQATLFNVNEKFSHFIKNRKACPSSATDILSANDPAFESIKFNYQFSQLNENCYLLAKHIGHGSFEGIVFPNYEKIERLRNSHYWTFILNDFIYYLSGYEKEPLNFGLKKSLNS